MGILNAGNLELIYQHANRAYPNECCGFVLADGAVHEGTNIQDELHASSPERYSRRADNGYTFSVQDTVFLNASFRTDNPVVIIYHSHPDVGAYFSREDRDKALYLGEPIYPVAYLVVDVRKGVSQCSKLFEWSTDQFVCVCDMPG
ncbi:Sulfur carrier protein adenylyltransferase ThiF [Pseudomonas chlororaphis]